MNKLLTLLTLQAILLLGGCKNKADRIESDLERILVAKKFGEMLTDNHHSIAKHGGSPGPDIWLSKAIVYDRYVIKMSFRYRDVDSSGELTSSSDFVFDVYEHTYDNDGRWMSEGIGDLSLDQWKGVKTVDDIFAVIEVVPKKNSPIKDLVAEFEEDKQQASD